MIAPLLLCMLQRYHDNLRARCCQWHIGDRCSQNMNAFALRSYRQSKESHENNLLSHTYYHHQWSVQITVSKMGTFRLFMISWLNGEISADKSDWFMMNPWYHQSSSVITLFWRTGSSQLLLFAEIYAFVGLGKNQHSIKMTLLFPHSQWWPVPRRMQSNDILSVSLFVCFTCHFLQSWGIRLSKSPALTLLQCFFSLMCLLFVLLISCQQCVNSPRNH